MAKRKSEDDPAKKEYEETLNKALGLQVRWSKLSLQELEEISNKVASLLMEKGNSDENNVGNLIDLLVPKEYQGPALKLLRKVLNNIK